MMSKEKERAWWSRTDKTKEKKLFPFFLTSIKLKIPFKMLLLRYIWRQDNLVVRVCIVYHGKLPTNFATAIQNLLSISIISCCCFIVNLTSWMGIVFLRHQGIHSLSGNSEIWMILIASPVQKSSSSNLFFGQSSSTYQQRCSRLNLLDAPYLKVPHLI